MISIRILNKIGARYGQEYATRFGFDADKNPPYLTLALGAGATTPLQMAGAYSVFANGGYRVSPYLISKVTDADGKVLSEARPDRAGVDANRVIDERNAFLVDSMVTLREMVFRFGRSRMPNLTPSCFIRPNGLPRVFTACRKSANPTETY